MIHADAHADGGAHTDSDAHADGGAHADSDAHAYEPHRDSLGTSMTMRLVYASIGVAIVAFCIWRPFAILFAVLIGAAIPISLFSYLAIGVPVSSRPPLDLPRFRFVENFHRLKTDQSAFAQSQLQRLPLIENSEQINSSLNSLVELVLKVFVENWYTNISSSPAFINLVRSELNIIVKELVVRTQKPDLAIRIVKQIIPAFRDHFDRFVKADIASRTGDFDSDLPYHVKVARKYNDGNFHPALCHTDPGNNSREKVYLKTRLSKVAALLLLTSSQDDENVSFLVNEILACTISYNVVSLLSDSDFVFVLMISILSDNLKHRGQAKQLRAALEQHSRKISGKASMMSLRVAKDSLEGITTFYTISPDVDLASVKMMIASISKIESVKELHSIMQYVISQLRAISVMSTPDISRMAMIERLQLLKTAIEYREHKLNPPECVTRMPDSFGLIDIVGDPRGFQCFSQYLHSTGRQHLLDFWNQVQLITVPLDYETATCSTSLSFEFSTIDDMRRIYHTFIKYDDLVALGPESFTTIKEKICGAQEIPERDLVSCRQALLKAQLAVFQEMDRMELPPFKESIEFKKFEKWILSRQPNPRASDTPHPTVDLIETQYVDDDDDDDDTDASSDILESVESELGRIMQSASDVSTQQNKEKSSISEKSSVHLDDSFGKAFFSSDAVENCLFDDLSDVSDCDSLPPMADISPVAGNSPDEVRSAENQASSGTHNFAQEISYLTHATQNINDQIEIVQRLLQKAELSNNTPQLKVLRRSLFSLEREHSCNQLQIEQLVIQRDKSSLFRKIKIKIQLHLQRHEKGRPVISYVVEIQEAGLTDKDLSAAGWILARRFSQFYRLHDYLRARYPDVAKLPFPKRTVHLLKAQQEQLIDSRKTSLESYLRNLIEIPQVCDNAVLRSFLSCEDFHLPNENGKVNCENEGSPNPAKTFGNLFQAVSQDTFTRMQRELHDFESATSPFANPQTPDQTFVRPICDLLISLFSLDNPRAWLRGRALIVLLQRVLGTTVDHKVQAQIESWFATETGVTTLLTTFTNMIFPGGKFRELPPARTVYQKRIAYQEARALLHLFMSETWATIFGSANTASASSFLSKMILIDVLNKQFVYQVFDIILEELFPEISSVEK